MRYKISLQYDGSAFSGWQMQDNALSVQQVIEEKLSTRLQEDIRVVGCGRTDAGVHASDYVLHFDTSLKLSDDFLYRVNKMLPDDIALIKVEEVSVFFHARFDAVSRSYIYRIHTTKNPFMRRYSYYFPAILQADTDKMVRFASLIKQYQDFEPFCKAHSDVRTKKCQIRESKWIISPGDETFEFHITADRFLRGMVRLIVGTSIQLGLGKIEIEEIRQSLDNQKPIPRPLSVPAEGLFLSAIKY